jgi:DNA-binding transcriptional regulator YdaS (Cro superfamily)
MQTNQVEAIQTAARILGNQAALARALGVTPVTVGQWLKPGKSNGPGIPPKQCVRIEQITQGQVSRQAMREDWLEFWPELAQNPAEPAQAAIETVAGVANV